MFSTKKSNLFQLLLIIFMTIGPIFLKEVLSFYSTISNHKIDFLSTSTSIVIIQIGFVLCPVLIYLLYQKNFVKNSFYLKAPGIFNTILSILLMIVLLPTTGLINYTSQFFVRNHIEGAITTMKQSPYPFALLIMAVFPGIFEELATRYLILNHYRYKPYYLSCIMSGLFFGMLHLNINQFLYAFFLGVVFSYLVQVTGSLWISILMHFSLNALSVTIAFYSDSSSSASSADLPTLFSLLGINIITIPIALLILWKVTQYNGKLAILKQKPTTLELTLGKKFAEFKNDSISYPNTTNLDTMEISHISNPTNGMPIYQENLTSPSINNQWYEAGNLLNGPESYEIHLAKKQTAFNWSFWAYVIIFIAISISIEALKR